VEQAEVPGWQGGGKKEEGGDCKVREVPEESKCRVRKTT
jgi:hypothetical protein